MPNKRLLIAFLIPAVILASMTVIPLLTVFYGQEIRLETEPYDPRDLFRGDYVSLHYKINTLDGSQIPPDIQDNYLNNRGRYSDNLYAVLKESNGFYTIDYLTSNKPKTGIYLIGRVAGGFYTNNEIEQLSIEYNLDRYFVPENTGRELEKMSRQGQLVARVKVFRGYPLLMEVFPKE